MRRRAFFLNSVILLLLIPILLLLATYEDVSSQVIHAQSMRTQAERTYRVVSYFEMDFQKALEISGKRAIITVIDYVAVTGNFIPLTYMANNTIRDLILEGTSPSLVSYDPERIMKGQTMREWLRDITADLKDQGFEINPSIDEILNSMELTVAPLDSFRIVVKARIPNITIRDVSGKVVYIGPIPTDGNYTYSIVDLQDLEDPVFSAMTGGRYHRSLRACQYPFPELLDRPFRVLYGNGSSDVSHVAGTLSTTLDPNKIYFGDYYPGTGAMGYVLLNEPDQDVTVPVVFNTTSEGTRTSPLDVFNEGDMGVLVFGNVSGTSSGTGTSWCSVLEYRLNITVRNDVGQDLDDYQIPILISSAKDLTEDILSFLFTNTQTDNNQDIYRNGAAIQIYDSNCTPVSFWIEYWDAQNKKALIWIRDSLKRGQSKTYSIYFGSGTPTKGNGDDVFIFFDDFEENTVGDKWTVIEQTPTITNGELYVQGGDSVEAIRTKNEINYDGSFAIRFRMRASSNKKWQGSYLDWDSGVGFQDSTEDTYWPMYFTDDVRDLADTLAIHEGGWWRRETSANQPRSGLPIEYHLYEAYLVDTGVWYDSNTKEYDAKFKDITDGRINWDTKYDKSRLLDPPVLKYLYIVNDNDESGNAGIYDFVFVRKYPSINGQLLEDPNFNGIYITSPQKLASDIDQKPSSQLSTFTSARAYDIQPFIDCILDQRYFGIYNAPSFFERLEGSTTNHETYETLARRMQDELGVKYGSQYYPIGLVSFMIPDPTYDQKLFDLFNTLGLSIEEGQTSFDYYFLQYYFKGGAKVTGYRMWGVSQGVTSQGDLSSVPFFIDNQTAVAIFGVQGAQDLVQR